MAGEKDDGVTAWSATVADAAHAVRGPYAAALPALEMLLEGLLGDVTPRQLAAIETAEHAVGRAARTAADIVTLAGAAVGGGHERPAPCTVKELADAVRTVCRATGLPVPEMTAECEPPPVLVDKPLVAAALAVLCGRTSARSPELSAKSVPEIRIDSRGCSGATGGSAAPDTMLVMNILTLGADTSAPGADTSAPGAGAHVPADSGSDERERDAALILCRGIIETAGGRLMKIDADQPAFRVRLPAARDDRRRHAIGPTGDR